MSTIVGPVGGGDFPADAGDRGSQQLASGERPVHADTEWNRLLRALNRDLPRGLADARASRRRIRRLR